MISTIADYADNNVLPHFDQTGTTRAAAKFAVLTARVSPKFAIQVAMKYHQLLNAFFSAMGADDVDREIDIDERVFQEFVGTEGYEMKVRDGVIRMYLSDSRWKILTSLSTYSEISNLVENKHCCINRHHYSSSFSIYRGETPQADVEDVPQTDLTGGTARADVHH